MTRPTFVQIFMQVAEVVAQRSTCLRRQVGAGLAYECSNPDSEYYKSLLNISVNGEKLKRIS